MYLGVSMHHRDKSISHSYEMGPSYTLALVISDRHLAVIDSQDSSPQGRLHRWNFLCYQVAAGWVEANLTHSALHM